MSLFIESSNVADADTFLIVSPAVCANLIKCSSLLYSAIKCNDVVVTYFLHTFLAVPFVNVARVEVPARSCCRAVDDDVIEVSHC